MIGYTKPEKEILKPFVKYIHFLTANTVSDRRLILFPNVGAAISFHFNTVFKEISHQKLMSEEHAGNHSAVLHINRIDPVEILERGKQERITVVFRPFGVNHFLNKPIGMLSQGQNPSVIDIAAVDERYRRSTIDLAKTETRLRIGFIEDFLHSVFIPQKEEILVSILDQFSENEKLTDIAAKAATTTKTMDRLFKKHIGITPVEYKRILKFRTSLNLNLFHENRSLTDLAFNSNYPDLPYMMKTYRKFTGNTAKQFFDSLKVEAGGHYLYHIN